MGLATSMSDEPLYCLTCGGELGADCLCTPSGWPDATAAENVAYCHTCGVASRRVVCEACSAEMGGEKPAAPPGPPPPSGRTA